jgi:dipeptidyl aminopeptidase/acylaminoacyl peptidase
VCVSVFAASGMLLRQQPGGLLAFFQPAVPTASATAEAATPLAGSPTPMPVAAVTLTPSLQPSPTAEAPTATLAPTGTDTPEPTLEPTAEPTAAAPLSPPVIGGADKIAFISSSNIYVANLDGSDLRALTQDGSQKSSLQWTPDGSAVVYIVGKCVKMVSWQTGKEDIVACFNYVQYLEEFEISPDGSMVAISLDRDLYIVPYQLEQLAAVKVRSDLVNMSECKSFAPYARNKVKELHWSYDGKLVAIKIMVPLEDGRLSDNIQVISVDRCIPNPAAQDNFPSPRFHKEMKGYLKTPSIQNFSWDGYSLFVLGSQVRNDGFGDLFIYNMELHKASLEVNPLGGCCYRDPVWSPDGSHLAFAYQDIGGGSSSVTQIYLVPYGTVGTGATYSPLPLPEIQNPKEKPQIALRPVR